MYTAIWGRCLYFTLFKQVSDVTDELCNAVCHTHNVVNIGGRSQKNWRWSSLVSQTKLTTRVMNRALQQKAGKLSEVHSLGQDFSQKYAHSEGTRIPLKLSTG